MVYSVSLAEALTCRHALTVSLLQYYLFAYVAEYQAERQTNGGEATSCMGPACFQLTYWVCAASSAVALVGMLIIGYRWKL